MTETIEKRTTFPITITHREWLSFDDDVHDFVCCFDLVGYARTGLQLVARKHIFEVEVCIKISIHIDVSWHSAHTRKAFTAL